MGWMVYLHGNTRYSLLPMHLTPLSLLLYDMNQTNTKALRLIIIFTPEYRDIYAYYATKRYIIRVLFTTLILGIGGAVAALQIDGLCLFICKKPYCMVFGEYRYLAGVLFLLACPLVGIVYFMKKQGIKDMVGIQVQLKGLAITITSLLVPLIAVEIAIDYGHLSLDWAKLAVALGQLMMGCCFILV